MKRFLKFALGLLIAILIGWVLYGFINEWLAVSSIATLILALAAFWAIWQNYELHKRERKERLLNEIIEWGQLLSSWSNSKIEQGLTGIGPIKENVLYIICGRIGKQIDDILSINGRTIYILKLSQSFDTELRKAIINTVNQINTLHKYLIEWKEELDRKIDKDIIYIKIDQNDLSNISNIDTYISNLRGNAENVIEEATKLKAKDIR